MTRTLTELVFILDRSGSMGGLERDTIGGYNAMLAKQQARDGECRLTTVLFDDRYELLHDRLDLRAVSPITDRDYYVRGSTALLDAIGKTIHKIGSAQQHSKSAYRAGKVLFVITTDGMENASREYDHARVKAMIARQKARYGWEFLFLGANIDTVETAGQFGIAPDRAQNYHADGAGLDVVFSAVAKAAVTFRDCDALPACWNEDIQEDYRNRSR
ncbi:MAG: hypothetical protein LBT60_01675 [Oscillospiraceae bacterium]|jgi:uncharacterized protein YegL|nr:hypothetical protein [Oscillospiraceae bacterium]